MIITTNQDLYYIGEKENLSSDLVQVVSIRRDGEVIIPDRGEEIELMLDDLVEVQPKWSKFTTVLVEARDLSH